MTVLLRAEASAFTRHVKISRESARPVLATRVVTEAEKQEVAMAASQKRNGAHTTGSHAGPMLEKTKDIDVRHKNKASDPGGRTRRS